MSKKFRTLDDVDVKGKRVLLRIDLNVPMENGRVSDATRIERVLPTIREISGKGGKAIKDGDVLVLENTRFHAGEEKNDAAFVKELAKNGDIYVNDAFS